MTNYDEQLATAFKRTAYHRSTNKRYAASSVGAGVTLRAPDDLDAITVSNTGTNGSSFRIENAPDSYSAANYPDTGFSITDNHLHGIHRQLHQGRQQGASFKGANTKGAKHLKK